MTHVWALILGVVQGLTEFLPISSSAHLALIPQVSALHVPAEMASVPFDIALHLGSALAILIALWGDWVETVGGAVRGESFDRRVLGFLVVTSIPGAVFGALFDDAAQRAVRAPLVIAVLLMIMGVVLWAVDTYVQREDPFERMTWSRATIVGFAQALAIFPGVSRSGVTITAGRATGLSREAIAKYSFMAALPIILGAGLFGLRHTPVHTLFSIDWVIGFLAAFVSSVVAMRGLLAYLRRHSLAVFAVYRLVLGALIVLLVLNGAM